MYDDDDDFPAPKNGDKSKEDKDRENAEMFRKVAEEEAKRAAEAKQGKKGWGFTGWFGGGGAAKKESQDIASQPGKPIRAKLGEANSFYYDPEQKRWINKNAGPEDNAAKKGTPPPPKSVGGPRSATSSPAPPMGSAPGAAFGDAGRASAPPAGPPRPSSASPMLGPTPPGPVGAGSSIGALPPMGGSSMMMRSASGNSTASAPPSRPATSLSTSSSIDDLLGAAGPRKAGQKKPRKSARYVDVMNS